MGKPTPTARSFGSNPIQCMGLHFVAARAMPDGALAVALAVGDQSILVMRLYVHQVELATRIDYGMELRQNWYGDRYTINRPRLDVDMKFMAGETFTISRAEYDEQTYYQRIPEYRHIPVTETRALPAPNT